MQKFEHLSLFIRKAHQLFLKDERNAGHKLRMATRPKRTRKFFHDLSDRLKNHSKSPARGVQDPEPSAGSLQPQNDSVAQPGSIIESKSSETKPEPEPTQKHKSLWEAAYNLLDETEKDVLSTVRISETSDSSDPPQDTRDLLDTVIKLTKEQYNDYKNGGWKIPISGKGHINVREVSENIITKALLFKDIITPLAALDPTQHASAAWSIAGFGLTVSTSLQRTIFSSVT